MALVVQQFTPRVGSGSASSLGIITRCTRCRLTTRNQVTLPVTSTNTRPATKNCPPVAMQRWNRRWLHCCFEWPVHFTKSLMAKLYPSGSGPLAPSTMIVSVLCCKHSLSAEKYRTTLALVCWSGNSVA